MTGPFPRRVFSLLPVPVPARGRLRGLTLGVAIAACVVLTTTTRGALPDGSPAALSGLTGGLVVQLGSADVDTPVVLGQAGQYLVHVLGTTPEAVAGARARCRSEGVYGLVSVEEAQTRDRLPYAENLVNLVIVDMFSVPAEELFRVVAPNGAVVVRRPGLVGAPDLIAAGFTVGDSGRMPLIARKPWPEQMDSWSHPRHAADGNAVSDDTLVGPPARVRWVAGALSEVEGVVAADGRNFYGGLLARDSFNGLRLWHRDLRKAETNATPFMLPRIAHNCSRPVASDAFVFVAERDRLVALRATDGQPVRTFDGVVRPTDVVHCEGILIACWEAGINAYRADTGALLWSHPAPGPRNLAADRNVVSFIHGRPARGETVTAVVVATSSGAVRWERPDYSWLKQVRRVVLRGELLAYELSSFNDHDAGNSLHVLSTVTGDLLWEKDMPPGMNHNRQTRAMFVDNDLWVLHGGKTNTADPEHIKRLPIQISALDPRTGTLRTTHPAGLAHCFPPVATRRFLFSGVMDLTDLVTGELSINPITKANCSRENGWVPANGLIYTTPKHCTCWPILRGYVALAPAVPGRKPVTGASLSLDAGPATIDPDAGDPTDLDWPLYRHDRWRSAGTPAPGPQALNRLWSVSLVGTGPVAGPILHDWRGNEFVKGPVSAPTVAYGRVYVTRPDAHEVVALDAATGDVSWRFTANGRVDTPPALHRGLCLFGSRAGSVYALRADTGRLVWRLQVGAPQERIVAYGQLESPWPVPGAVLVSNGVAYFAAGRQPLADGGIFVFAVDPLSGQQLWRHQLDSIPQKGFYENSGLEFDSFDILHQEGDGIALSRWVVAKDGKAIAVDKWNAFARLDTGEGGGVWVPRGWWTYGPRHQDRFRGEAPRRPLCVFQGAMLISSLNGTTELFRRDFGLKDREAFNSRWITGWEAAQTGSKGGSPFRTSRLAEKARWTADPFRPAGAPKPGPRVPGKQMHNDLHAMVLAGDGRLFVVHRDGRLKAITVADGSVQAETQVASPAWDALAVANRRLYLTTQAGDVLCIGE